MTRPNVFGAVREIDRQTYNFKWPLERRIYTYEYDYDELTDRELQNVCISKAKFSTPDGRLLLIQLIDFGQQRHVHVHLLTTRAELVKK